MNRPALSQAFSGLLLVFMMLFSFTADAAKLAMDRDEISVGEITTVHVLSLPFIAMVEWKVSPELEITDSDKNHVRVRGAREGAGRVTCDMNLRSMSVTLNVRAAAAAVPAAPLASPAYTPPSYPAPAAASAPAQDVQSSLAGTWQINANGYSGKLELQRPGHERPRLV